MSMTREQKGAACALIPDIFILDAIQFSRAYREAYGVAIDWHEFSYLLDALYTKGLLEISKPGGFVQYRPTTTEITAFVRVIHA
jgi:hypothetical protein